MNIVDRRPNPKGKSLSNRQRFLARARAEVKSAVQEALRKRKVADVGHGEKARRFPRAHGGARLHRAAGSPVGRMVYAGKQGGVGDHGPLSEVRL